jgi:nucleoid-associated protein YgaU
MGIFKSAGSATAPPPARLYTVIRGETLQKIAKREYGKARHWKKIYEANQDVIKDPEVIRPGQMLRLPD